MRGRTNVTQRAVPYVNGEVITAEVETGTINVGDFVEYKTIMQQQQITTNYSSNLCEKLTQHYKFVLTYVYNNIIMFECYNLRDMSLRCHLSFTVGGSTIRGVFDVIDESNIILSIYAIGGATSSTGYYLTIVDDDFVINQETQILGGSFSVTIISSSRFVTGAAASTSGNFIYIYEYDYTNKTFSYLISKKLDDYAIYSSGNYQFGKYLSENLFAYFKSFRFKSNGDDSVHCYLVQYDPSDGTIETLQTLTLSSSSTGASNFLYLNEDTIFNLSYSTITKTTGVITIVGYDRINNRLEVKTTLNPSNTWDKAFSASLMSLFVENKIVVQTSKASSSNSSFGLSIFTYNKETEQCSISDELVISTSNNFEFVFGVFNQNDEFIVYYTLTDIKHFYKQLLTYINSKLNKAVDTNYVKQYTGENAIGFAKTSGNQGEEVRIYIPKVS